MLQFDTNGGVTMKKRSGRRGHEYVRVLGVIPAVSAAGGACESHHGMTDIAGQ